MNNISHKIFLFQNLLEFLDTVEEKFGKLGAVSSDIDSVKSQIDQLKVCKNNFWNISIHCVSFKL